MWSGGAISFEVHSAHSTRSRVWAGGAISFEVLTAHTAHDHVCGLVARLLLRCSQHTQHRGTFVGWWRNCFWGVHSTHSTGARVFNYICKATPY